MLCRHCATPVSQELEHYDDELGCWQCPPSKEERTRLEEVAKHASLVSWFRRCPFDAYSLGALEAAYKALVEFEE